MGLFDRLAGTRHPEDGVVPRPAEEVRAGLLGVNRPGAAFVVRDGAPDHADLVAEWRMAEPAWQTVFVESRMTRAVRIRMRLVRQRHEVRALEEGWEVTRAGDPPQLRIGRPSGRGPAGTVSRFRVSGRGGSGAAGTAQPSRFSGAELRGPLQDAVLRAGWVWRGVVFGTL